MNSKKTSSIPGMDWQDLQKKYLEACQVFNQFIPGMDTNAAPYHNPLMNAAEQWWKSVAPSLSGDNAAHLNKIMEQGRILYFFADQFVKMSNAMSKLDKAGRDWETTLNKQFDEMKTAYGKMQKDASDIAHKMAGIWQLMPMDTLQRTLSLNSFLPGDFLGEFKHEDLRKMSDKFLSIPGVGYTRESQEQLQVGMRLWNEYQQVAQEFNQAMAKVGMEAMEAMHMKIMAMTRDGKGPESLRVLYDLWVDCNEDAYAAFLHKPEFSSLYGRLTNALMAVKHHGRNMVDESLGSMSAPTHKGISTLQKRQYEMGRQHKDAMKKILDLQQEIAELHNSIKHSGTEARARTTAPAKKTTTRKAPPKIRDNKRKTAMGASAAGQSKVKQVNKDKMIVIRI